ncbi:MAG: peptidylprolyl isomerase [Myxococcota bacterium]
MTIVLRRVLLEPLVHFSLIAAIVFIIDSRLRPDIVEPDRISVSANFIRWLADTTARRTGRPPGAHQLKTMVDDHIDQEIMVREAARLGLTDGDPIVRRRIAQKMRFLLESPSLSLLDDEQLRAHLKANAARYTTPTKFRVVQVYLGSRTPTAEQLHDLKRTLAKDPEAPVGRPLAMGRDLGWMTARDLQTTFIKDDAKKLQASNDATWVGPIKSRFGYHLARIQARKPARTPTLDEIRPRVKADLLKAVRQKTFDAEIARLRRQYTIDVEWPSPPAGESLANLKAKP